MGFQAVLEVKNPPASTGGVRDLGSVPGSGRFPGGGKGNLLQCSCLENPHGQRSLAGYSPWGPQRVRHDRSDFVHFVHSYKSDCAGKVVEVILGGVKHAACSWSLLCESEKRR